MLGNGLDADLPSSRSLAGDKARQVNVCLKLKRASVDTTERKDLRVGEVLPEEVIFGLGLKEVQEFPSVDREPKVPLWGRSSQSAEGRNGGEGGWGNSSNNDADVC